MKLTYGQIGRGRRLHLFLGYDVIALCGLGPKEPLTEEPLADQPAKCEKILCKLCARRREQLRKEGRVE